MTDSPKPPNALPEAQRRALVAAVQMTVGVRQPFIILLPMVDGRGTDVVTTIKDPMDVASILVNTVTGVVMGGIQDGGTFELRKKDIDNN